ncbi:MAG: molecular chaperone TorD family protein [Deltaproteobacteria bacterium]|nr:molecular chaperone TorD family protein [Deltaproteobacteria bacterium]
MITDTFSEIAKKRSHIYGFFAGIFKKELDSEQLKEMIQTRVFNLLIDGGADIDLAFFNRPLERVEEELACEYAALFIGPGKHIAPYESIYVPDSTGRVGEYWGECTVDMKNWVEHYGLKIDEKFESIPDHISIELEFMQKIIEQENLAWNRNDRETAERCLKVEKEFFKKHIIQWIPEFCEKVIEAAEIDFYREMARMTKDFILEEKQMICNISD